MQRGSDKHGFRLDDAMERETRGLVQAGRDTRAEEWRSAEPAGEDQPDVDRAPSTTLAGGTPEGMSAEDLDARAELAAALGKEVWPAETVDLRAKAAEADAPDRVIDLLAATEERTWTNLAELWEHLTGEAERTRF